MVLAILEEGHPRNISVKLFRNNWPRRRCHLKVFLFFFFLALSAILFKVAEGFEQFW